MNDDLLIILFDATIIITGMIFPDSFEGLGRMSQLSQLTAITRCLPGTCMERVLAQDIRPAGLHCLILGSLGVQDNTWVQLTFFTLRFALFVGRDGSSVLRAHVLIRPLRHLHDLISLDLRG